ncbi:MAG: TIGR00725 family protein [Nitrososphaerales archaeon]
MKQIAVIGSAEEVSPEVERMAEEVGRGIARRGAVLISGGRGGVMEASCRGAKKENGLVVGILPMSRDQANRYVDVAIATGMGDARNVLNVNSADAVISICGGAGTLSEIGLALKAGKKVVALKPSGGVSSMLAGRSIDGKTVIAAGSVEEALRIVFE